MWTQSFLFLVVTSQTHISIVNKMQNMETEGDALEQARIHQQAFSE